jgi:hypothetical protein
MPPPQPPAPTTTNTTTTTTKVSMASPSTPGVPSPITLLPILLPFLYLHCCGVFLRTGRGFSLVVRTVLPHSGDPGSNPRQGRPLYIWMYTPSAVSILGMGMCAILKVLISFHFQAGLYTFGCRVNVHNLVQAANWRSLVKTSLELQSCPLFQINRRPKIP